MRAFTAVLLALAVGLGSPLGPTLAFADARAEAAEHFERGAQLYREGNYRAALIAFRRAYQLAPHYRVLFNLGQAQYQMGDYAGALNSFEQYLEEGESRIDDERRDAVTRDIERLRTRVAHVDLVVATEGVRVYVDEIEVGVTPLSEPLVLSTGRRTISLRKTGHREVKAVLDLAGGDRRRLALDLEPPPAVERPPSPEPRSQSATAVPWPAWATTAGFGTGAIVFGALALSAAGTLDELKNQPHVAPSALEAARDRMLALSIVSDLMAAGALISGGIAIYLTVENLDAPNDASALSVTLGPQGCGLRGSF